MEQNELRFYEAAFTLCLGDKEKGLGSKVRATYTTFTSDGKKYFQIDTYGSPTREMKDKISQSIQVDKEMAKELIKLMMETFDILD